MMVSQSVISKIALPYAEALLESAQLTSLVDSVKADLLSIVNLLSESSDLKLFLENPLITPLAKKNVLNQLFSEQINQSVLNFLLVLVDRRRISLINIIIDKYLELAYKLESVVLAEVSTATLLTEDQQNQLMDKIKTLTSSKEVKLIIHEDSSLIAGFKVKVGSKIIDTSILGQLKQMASYLNSL